MVLLRVLLGFYLASAGHGGPLLDGRTHDGNFAESPRQRVPFEPGVRFRLYWVGHELNRLFPLMPDQSPNIDAVIPGVELTGAEPVFTDTRDVRYRSQFIGVLECELRIDRPGRHHFRLRNSEGAELSIDRAVILENPRHDGRGFVIGGADLDTGHRSLTIRYFVDDGSRHLKLEWQPPGQSSFSSIPGDLLRTESYYFRPTHGGRKRLDFGNARPGSGLKLAGVHPGFDRMTVRPEGMEMPVGGLGMLSDGRLVVATFDARRLKTPEPQPDPDGELWLLDGVQGENRAGITATRIADGLFEPAGVCVVGEAIYVSQRSEIARFTYNPGLRVYEKSVVASGWETNDFHQLSLGLIHEPGPDDHPGFLYLARSPGLGKGENPPNHGSVWKIDLSRPPGRNVEYLTGGHRTPNGIGFGPGNQIFVSDNQGEWTPANELNHVRRGHFYGYNNPLRGPASHQSPFQNPSDRLSPGRGVTPPAIQMPQDEIANSPSQPILIPKGLPFEGQMLIGDVKYGGINRIFLEEVNGVWQGAVFRFTMGLESGINRLVWGPDGSLYAGGIGGDHASTWAWVNPEGERTYQGLQRLRPNGKKVFEISAIRSLKDGFEIEFNRDVAAEHLENPRNFRLRQWSYTPTAAYGGSKEEEEDLRVTRAVPSADLTRVRLVVPGLKTGRVVYIHTDPVSVSGERLWSTEGWYTLNELPR